MAKEQIHNYLRTGVTLAVIVFAGGGWTFQIAGNTTKIAEEKRERREADKLIVAKTDRLQEETHSLALNAKDTQAIAVQGVESLSGIHLVLTLIKKDFKEEMAKIKEDQGTITTDIAVMKTKYETLTKD